MTPGIHLIHKPVGPSSFARLQEFIQTTPSASAKKAPKSCHGGTLDPFASGLLLVLVEPATRLFDHLHAIPKVYETTIRWGIETDNGDPLGRVTFTGDPANLSEQQLDDLLPNFIGWHDQIPPATSAKRIDGERAYEKAHRGETVVMPPSRVYLHAAQWLDHDLPHGSRLRITARGGYYIRALARDMGRSLGCGAHLTTLHRAAIGPWSDPGPDRSVELRGRDILPWLPIRLLSDQDVGDLRNDQTILPGKQEPADWALPSSFPESDAMVRGFHLGRFCFLLQPCDGRLKTIIALRGGL